MSRHRSSHRRRSSRRTRDLVVEDLDSGRKRSRHGSRRRRRHRLRRALIAVVVLVALAGAVLLARQLAGSWVGERSAAAYEDALQHFDAREYQRAVVALERILDNDRGHLAARVLLGRSYLALGYAERAEQALRDALAQGADERLVTVPLARAYLLQGKHDRVLGMSVSQNEPELEAGLLVVQGEAYLELRRLDEADGAFAKASDLSPDDVRPILGRARVLMQRQQPEDALKLVDRAGSLDPDALDVWRVRAELAAERRSWQEAADAWGQVLEREPHDLEAHRGRASQLIRLDRDEEALADLRAVWEVRPDDPVANYHYAVILTRQGEIDHAEQVLERAALGLMSVRTESLMRHPPSLLVMGVLQFRNRNYESAFTLLDRYVRLEPRDVDARKLLATVMLIRDLPSAALEVLEPAAADAPDDAEVLALMAQAYGRTGRSQRSEKLLRRAARLETDPATVKAQLALSQLSLGTRREGDDLDAILDVDTAGAGAVALVGLLQVRQGNLRAALATLTTLVQERPDDAMDAAVLAVVQLVDGDLAGARASAERALALDPENPSAARTLARVELGEGDAEGAAARLSGILEHHPGDLRTLLALAATARRGGNLDQAIEWLMRAVEVDREALAPRLELVDAYLEDQRVDEARTLVDKLAERFPRSVPVRIARGRVELAAGERGAASKTFRTLAEERNASPQRLYRLAEYQLATDDVEGARATLGRVLDLDGSYAPALESLIELDLRAQDSASALERTKRLRAERPGDPLGDRLYGDVLMQMHRYRDAEQAYRAALTKAQRPEFAVGLFQARRAEGDRIAALAELEAWAARHDDAPEAERALALGYLEAGRFADARNLYEALLETEPEDPRILAGLARIYVRTGDSRAIDLARHAQSVAPHDPDVLDTLGWVLVRTGVPARGLHYLREAENRSARNPRIRYHVAAALAALDRADEARRSLGRLLRQGAEFEGSDGATALFESLGGRRDAPPGTGS